MARSTRPGADGAPENEAPPLRALPPDLLDSIVENMAEALAQAVRRDLAAEAQHGACLRDD